MSRVTGRTVLPTTEEEKYILHKLGLDSIRVPRSANPYQVARHLRRAVLPSADVQYLADIAQRTRIVRPSAPTNAVEGGDPGASAICAG